jgi:anti-sigma factor RsiW
VRCSSCELLLDRYIEGTLTPREMARVRAHLGACERCASLLGEVRVIDALLATTKAVELPPNFTFAVMAEARTLHVHAKRRFPLWGVLAGYLVAAWAAATAVYVAFGPHGAFVDWLRAAASNASSQTGTALTVFAHSIFGPSVPVVLGGVVTVLAVDVLLAAAGLVLYRAHHARIQRSEAV